jgi:tellurite resistance protein TehA-like permease
MINLICAIVALIFALFALFMKNENFKPFFFLLSMLMIVISFAASSAYYTIYECTNADCSAYKSYIQFDATPFIWGFGLLIILFLSLYVLEIVVRAFEKIS